MRTIYFAQGFSWIRNGSKQVLRGSAPIECKSVEDAKRKAERMSAGSHAGVIAASQEYDDISNEYGVFNLLIKYGDTPQMEED